MAFCRNCGNQVNEGVKFCPKCGYPVESQTAQQIQHVAQQVQQPQEKKPMKPESGLMMAILSTLFCCLPLGIVAIVKANKVDKLYFAGDYKGAEEAASSAKTWAYVAMGVGLVVNISAALIQLL